MLRTYEYIVQQRPARDATRNTIRNEVNTREIRSPRLTGGEWSAIRKLKIVFANKSIENAFAAETATRQKVWMNVGRWWERRAECNDGRTSTEQDMSNIYPIRRFKFCVFGVCVSECVWLVQFDVEHNIKGKPTKIKTHITMQRSVYMG